jgi:uncharacterized membrane protein
MSTPDPQTQADDKETGRVEAFSDGVFAIAITLIILEIRVPHAEGVALVDALLQQWPSYLAYIISFLSIGVMWVNHHNLFKYIRRVDNIFLFLNSLLLMVICAVNFSTALLAEHILNPQNQQVASLVYSGVGIVIALLFNLLWRYATHENRLIGRQVDQRLTQAITEQYRFGPLLYLLAFALVFINIWLSLLLQAGLVVFFSLTDSTRIRAQSA